jgi:hypothetical protein
MFRHSLSLKIYPRSICLILTLALFRPCFAQSGQSLEHSLDRVGNSNWSSVPVSTPKNTLTPRQAIRREMARKMMESGAGAGANAPPVRGGGSSNAYGNWQEAENQASRAYHYSQTARYNKNRGSRESAASSADYAARAARTASDKVYQASNNGDPTSQQYASKARAAADRARREANRARYNADHFQ